MKFAKKLYIMTGQGDCKGAVTVERNAFGTFADVSIYNLRRTDFRRYFAFVSDSVLVFPMGRKNRFDLGEAQLNGVHVCVACAADSGLVIELYGTDGAKKMWQGNLCDKIRGKINVLETAATMETGVTQGALETAGEEKLLSLFPSEGKDFTYDDNAIAKVNYYSNIYSTRKKTPSEIAFEQARLAQLGEHLIRASLNVDEVCPPKAEEGKGEPLNKDCSGAEDFAARTERETDTAPNVGQGKNAPIYEPSETAAVQPKTAAEPFNKTDRVDKQSGSVKNEYEVFAESETRYENQTGETDNARERAQTAERAKNINPRSDGEPCLKEESVSECEYKCDYARFLYAYRDELLSGGGHGFVQGAVRRDAGEKADKTDEAKGAAAKTVASVQSESRADESTASEDRESAAAHAADEEICKPSQLYSFSGGARPSNGELPYSGPYYGHKPPIASRENPQSELKPSPVLQDGGKAALEKSGDKKAETESGQNEKKKTGLRGDGDAIEAPKADFTKSEQALQNLKPEKLNFYERVKSQIDRLFEANPREEALEKLLPESRFVRVAVENSEKYYCVGLLGKPDYICYAVPAAYTPQPPEELDGYCQWLPADAARPEGSGFWLIYQDAVTGESLTGQFKSAEKEI